MPTPFEAALLERCTFPERVAVDCAVSGGADSVALMLLAKAVGKTVTVWHVDHGLRENSGSEATFVKQLAERFEMGFESVAVIVDGSSNVEANARAARYDALPTGILTGHTADDQAETILMNVMRGAGLRGLGGMRPQNKPLLALRRRETEALCAEYNVTPFVDPSNHDKRFRRNRVRAEVLPLLSDVAERDVIDVIARQAWSLHEDEALLDELSARIDCTDAKALASAPAPLARRAIRRWLAENIDDERHPPSAAAVERVLTVARGEATACEVESGITVRRSQQRLCLKR